jgi:purine-binding chemotaxis protein CheW
MIDMATTVSTVADHGLGSLNLADPGDQGAQTTQFITFSVGEEEFGVDIITVREIKGWTDTTRLPNAPVFMRGVLNLRGTIVPIYDLRARFGLGSTEATSNHVIVIVAVCDRIVGMLVDAVSDILSIGTEQIRSVPEMAGTVDQRFLTGLVTVERRMVALLDLEQLFDLPAFDSSVGQMSA